MIIDRRQIDARLAGDQAQRGFRETLLREQLLCRIENALYGFRLGHGLSPNKHLFETYVSGYQLVKSRKPHFGQPVTFPGQAPQTGPSKAQRRANHKPIKPAYGEKDNCIAATTVYNPSNCIKEQSIPC